VIDFIPPQSMDIEKTVIASLLAGISRDEALGYLSGDDFFNSHHKKLFEIYKDTLKKHGNVDMVIMSDELSKIGDINLEQTLIGIVDSIGSVYNLIPCCHILREKRNLREAMTCAVEMVRECTDGSLTSNEIISNSLRKFNAILTAGTKIKPIHVSEFMDDVKATAERMKGGEVTGLSTGIVELDNMLCGMHKGEQIIIAGRPGMGKTSLMMQILIYIAETLNVPVLIVTLEMEKTQLFLRSLCSKTEVNFHSLRSGKMSQGDYFKFEKGIEKIKDLPIWVVDASTIKPNEIIGACRSIKGLGIVGIDYLTLMSSDEKMESKRLEIGAISRSTKLIARELNIPSMLLSQLSRACEVRGDKRPILSDLREAGDIEQDADVVLFVYRDELYFKKSDNKNKAEIIIGKQRNGPTGIVECAFISEFTRFKDLVIETGGWDDG